MINCALAPLAPYHLLKNMFAHKSKMPSNDPPLTDIKILVTRAGRQAQDFSEKLSALGASVIAMPLVEFAPPDSWQELDQAIDRLAQYDWIIFASSNAVRSFMERLNKTAGESALRLPLPGCETAETGTPCVPEKPSKSLPLQAVIGQTKAKIGVIGESTGKAVQLAGLSVDFQPDTFIAEDFVANFPGYPNLTGVKILCPERT